MARLITIEHGTKEEVAAQNGFARIVKCRSDRKQESYDH